ncbi:DUF2750 domain-containing protein [Photorhabdus viridis]|uniref:DUF2750 domain-containing protein n=1 Tax=Photorhabdus viridis TaxID=3163327 RepID=UPI0033071CBF
MKLSDKEIEVMSKKGHKDRYVYFIKRVVDNEAAWILDDEGFALTSDDIGNDILPLWPAREYAEACANGDWDGYNPKKIDLEYILDELLPDLSKDQIKLGIFMVPSITDTPIIAADSLLVDLQNECEKYN